MRLKKIKLSGFKSFVDPTTIPVSANLIGVVGPNGCGKSNIIDAVRWVMGESSAKHLRGDSMSDVIFSGSNTRKPVGSASVELIFDNTDGKAPGQYAAYAEISIRREASRDGQSSYFLNKTRCRRKDITDLFLGTGLGPRAYSIIEQGMVTRLVEAKPEELRGFLEEAAGISKYKERRRETENRIRHTRENLDRVEDIRSEMEVQLKKLQRQSKAAGKYKELKQQERLLHAQLLALRWKKLSDQLGERDSALSGKQTGLEAVVAEQREVEAKIEQIRSQQTEVNDHLNKVQAEFYSIGADISGIEQKIQHARETRNQWSRELLQVNESWEEASQHLQSDERLVEELERELKDNAPQLEASRARYDQAQEALNYAEQAMRDWQTQWQSFNELAAEPDKARDIQQARIEQLTQHLTQLKERQDRLESEVGAIEQALKQEDVAALRERASELDRLVEQRERQLEASETGISHERSQAEQLGAALEELRGRHRNAEARMTSLQELQAAAQGRHDEALTVWLQRHGLADRPRLSARVSVEPDWERAVEQALGARLAAVCVPGLNDLVGELSGLDHSELTLLETSPAGGAGGEPARETLLSKIQSDIDLSDLLVGVYVTETPAQAMAMRERLAANESVVTRSGIQLGRTWAQLANQQDMGAGVLERERDIEALRTELHELEQDIAGLTGQLRETQQRLQDHETQREAHRKVLNDANRERNEAHSRLGQEDAHLQHLQERRAQIGHEQREVAEQMTRDGEELATAERLMREAEGLTGSHEQRRQELQANRDALQQALEDARETVNRSRDELHRLDVERQRMSSTLESTKQSVTRLQGQLQHLINRRGELERLLEDGGRPEHELKERLDELLQQRVGIEGSLTEARQGVTGLDSALREQEQARLAHEKQAQELRQVLEEERMARQELVVRRETLEEQMEETGHKLAGILDDLPAEASEPGWQEELAKVTRRIDRLGPINLVAIEEYEEQSERKSYLDKQYDDLSRALATLEDAIRKIDRETRTRFKETFDKVNSGLQSFFPKLFGGGHAYLELTGDDLLEAGVAVMARPPGKRNSTIHLLSGGEKALTAVALIFSIFQLNPAPFCLLDEVDAPLDDANVERYGETLQEMAKDTQLLYVTHNKISMEIAEILLGVTMAEPGASRLVAVDVDEALEMVV